MIKAFSRKAYQPVVSDIDRRDPPDAPMGIVVTRAHGRISDQQTGHRARGSTSSPQP
jgi:hypothetical protein